MGLNLVTDKVYFDPRYYTMAGYEPGEFPSSFDEWAKRPHTDDHPCVIALFSRISPERRPRSMEFAFAGRTALWMWIRCGSGRRVESDANGNAVRMVGTHIDITELKQQQEYPHQLS